ncbi:MAG: hypothetical protein R2856_00260 [Caldilineaceae bacterium]
MSNEKLDRNEKVLLASYEEDEWRSVEGRGRKARYQSIATATFAKDARVNIRISSKDLEAIQKRALEENSLSYAHGKRSAQVRLRAIGRAQVDLVINHAEGIRKMPG